MAKFFYTNSNNYVIVNGTEQNHQSELDIGKSSLTLELEARSHNVYSGTQSVILSTNIKFVRIDENGDSIPISDRVKTKYGFL